MEKYELLNQIGDGTFGSVAKAISKSTGQLVAIKKMKQKFYTWEECVKLPEVEVVRKIHGHPNIVKLREVIRTNNELFFVFEYMDGDMLGVIKKAKQAQSKEDAAKSPAIPYPKIKHYMRQLMQSLAYLHKRGYFHRDLKPENLLVKKEEHGEDVVKLGDFGLVKDIRARTPYTDYVSTRWYRAPELLLQDRSYGSPVDIWAAGCMMSELISTNPLFPGSNEVDQLFKIMSVMGSPNEKVWPYGIALAKKIRYSFPNVQGCGLAKVLPKHVPAAAIDLMNQMMTYDPKQRPTAEQCLQHPFFSVGIDESNGPSAATIDQLSLASQRLQHSPQSAPPALQGNAAVELQRDLTLGKRTSMDSLHYGQKYYMLGHTEPGTVPKQAFAPNTVAKKEASPLTPKVNGIKGLNVSNVNPAYKGTSPSVALLGTMKKSNGPTPASPYRNPKQTIIPSSAQVDLDGLMEEFASEIATMGISADKGTAKENSSPLASTKQPDPVAALLQNSRYKSTKESNSDSSLLLTRPLPAPKAKDTAPVTQTVSPSIRALLGKHRTGGFADRGD